MKRLLLLVCLIAGIGYAVQIQAQVAKPPGCTGPLSVSITGSGTGLPLTFGSATVTTPVACSGGSATVTFVVTGGTLPYSYTFNSQTNATGVFTGVSAGTGLAYSITDANGCGPITGTIDVTQPPLLSATIAETDNSGVANDMIICPGGSAGLDANPTGGTPGYTYAWDNSLPAQETHTVSPASTTTYNVTVTDANGCVAMASKTITVNPALSFASAGVTSNYNGAQISCAVGQGTSNDGEITVAATGGTPSYMYSKDGGTLYQASGVFPGLTAGSYTMVAKDANGCTASTPVSLTAPPPIVAGTCTNAEDKCQINAGSITVTGSGGTGTLNVTWTAVANLPFTGTPGGSPIGTMPTPVPAVYTGLSGNSTYSFTVTDANGCKVP